MSRNLLLTFLVVATMGGVNAFGQVCPLNGTSNSKMVCLIPQVYGPYGFGAGPGQPPSQTFCLRETATLRTLAAISYPASHPSMRRLVSRFLNCLSPRPHRASSLFTTAR